MRPKRGNYRQKASHASHLSHAYHDLGNGWETDLVAFLICPSKKKDPLPASEKGVKALPWECTMSCWTFRAPEGHPPANERPFLAVTASDYSGSSRHTLLGP